MTDLVKPDGQSAACTLQQIIDRAMDSGADSFTIEYAKDGGLVEEDRFELRKR